MNCNAAFCTYKAILIFSWKQEMFRAIEFIQKIAKNIKIVCVCVCEEAETSTLWLRTSMKVYAEPKAIYGKMISHRKKNNFSMMLIWWLQIWCYMRRSLWIIWQIVLHGEEKTRKDLWRWFLKKSERIETQQNCSILKQRHFYVCWQWNFQVQKTDTVCIFC